MQNQENCYKNVWILSGTSDGPVIANRLLELNYSVFASVLTYKAGQAYIENPKLHIITGKLNNKDEIINFIKKNQIKFFEGVVQSFELRLAQMQLYTAQNNFVSAIRSVINKKTQLESLLNSTF